jgi:hypothetical protein
MTRNIARWRRALPTAAKTREPPAGRLVRLRFSELILAATIVAMVIGLAVHSLLSAAS